MVSHFYNLKTNVWYAYTAKHTVPHYFKCFIETEDNGLIDYIIVFSGKVEKGRASCYTINQLMSEYTVAINQRQLDILYGK